MTERERVCAEAIEKSREVIRLSFKQFKPEELAIAWTGGKDSTLTLWTIRGVCLEDKVRMPKVMIIDEYDSFEEIHVGYRGNGH